MPSAAAHGLRPTKRAPDLDLPLVGGGPFVLADATPGRFTMIAVDRGLQCPVCRAQLKELDRRVDDSPSAGSISSP